MWFNYDLISIHTTKWTRKTSINLKIFNFKKWNRDQMSKKCENKLEMKEIWKQMKGSTVIRERK